MERNNGESLLWFLIGAAAGASVALLYAPHPGHKTRRMLGRKLADGREALEERDASPRRGEPDALKSRGTGNEQVSGPAEDREASAQPPWFFGATAAGVPIDVGCSRPASVPRRAGTGPATDTKSGVARKTATPWHVTRSGIIGTAVTLRRGRRKYFLLTWGTL